MRTHAIVMSTMNCDLVVWSTQRKRRASPAKYQACHTANNSTREIPARSVRKNHVSRQIRYSQLFGEHTAARQRQTQCIFEAGHQPPPPRLVFTRDDIVAVATAPPPFASVTRLVFDDFSLFLTMNNAREYIHTHRELSNRAHSHGRRSESCLQTERKNLLSTEWCHSIHFVWGPSSHTAGATFGQ